MTKLSYADYLRLDQLLGAQRPVTGRPDELLFIVYHQVAELWFKLLLHELDRARRALRADDATAGREALHRAREVVLHLNGQWAVLDTLSPARFAEFRPALGNASGLHSVQYRALEFLLGRRDTRWLRTVRPYPGPPDHDTLVAGPSLFDEYLRHLDRKGHRIPAQLVERDWRRSRPQLPELAARLREMRFHPGNRGGEVVLSDTLAELDAELWEWRRIHLKTVARLIGARPGTGGTPGLGYLRGTVDQLFFPELGR